jgi:hypothetical protein
MPTQMTFTSLQSDVQGYLQRGTAADSLVYAQLPKLINNAERRIARELKVLGFQTPITTTLQPGVNGQVVAKPDRWRATISMVYGALNAAGAYNVRTPIFPRAYEYIRAYWPDDSVLGPPKFYADYDYSNWLIGPTPDLPYPVEIQCWMLPALLDANNQTNWTSNYCPDVLLYATLLECAPFIVNDARIPTWDKYYQDRMSGLSSEDAQRIIDRTTHRETP